MGTLDQEIAHYHELVDLRLTTKNFKICYIGDQIEEMINWLNDEQKKITILNYERILAYSTRHLW